MFILSPILQIGEPQVVQRAKRAHGLGKMVAGHEPQSSDNQSMPFLYTA